MASADYQIVGQHYSDYRTPDSRIAALINKELENLASIVNIGAGTGSYEPTGMRVSAVEPSATMLRQRVRKEDTTVFQAKAESLPFDSNSHDAALAILTIHHWEDWRKGLEEAYRVARKKVILLTWFPMPTRFWLYDYFPELASADVHLFPTEEEISGVLGELKIITVPIHMDCTDGFLCAYWARPEMYLDPKVRSAISGFSRIADTSSGVDRLSKDLITGAWREKYDHLLPNFEYDFGYRLVVGHKSA